MESVSIQDIAIMRLLVGYLGEKSQNNWWPSSFLAPESKVYLSPIYPRTVALAQYRGVSEAALLVHDEFIGIGKNYHLFRLPEAIEHSAADWVQSQGENYFSEMLNSPESASEALLTMASVEMKRAEGPVAVGHYSDSSLREILKQSAGFYLAAFQAGGKCYPYMREAE